MSVTNQYMCEYAQFDRRSVPAQLRGTGDGRADLYDLFLRMEGVKNGLVEQNGDVVDTYSAEMSGTNLTPALAWLLVRLNRLMVTLDSLNAKLSKVASSTTSTRRTPTTRAAAVFDPTPSRGARFAHKPSHPPSAYGADGRGGSRAADRSTTLPGRLL